MLNYLWQLLEGTNEQINHYQVEKQYLKKFIFRFFLKKKSHHLRTEEMSALIHRSIPCKRKAFQEDLCCQNA